MVLHGYYRYFQFLYHPLCSSLHSYFCRYSEGTIEPKRCWIGARELNDVWDFTDGTAYDESVIGPVDETNRVGEYCGYMVPDDTVLDLECYRIYMFLCQVNALQGEYMYQ